MESSGAALFGSAHPIPADTNAGFEIARLRRFGAIDRVQQPAGVSADPPRLSDDVRCALMSDESEKKVIGNPSV